MDTNIMPSPKENKVPTVDTTSLSRVIQSEPSCLPPHHPVFPEPSCAVDIPLGDVHGGSVLFSPLSSAFASTITPPTDALQLSTAPPSVSSNLPVSSPPSSAPSDEIISQYFRTKIPHGSPKRVNRIKYLVQAAKGFWDAALDQRLKDVSAIPSEIDTSFLYGIYIAHHVGLRLVKEKSEPGVGLVTPALDQTAKDLSLDRPTVKIEYTESKRYMELTLFGGPGSLLLTGRRARTVWRRRLVDGDVQLLLGYRARYIPHHYAKAVELNTLASKVIIKYMVGKGWRYEELASIQSMLMCCLRTHIDVEQLAREEGARVTSTHTLTHPGEHSGNRSPDHRTSQGASEELALKELLEAAEEPVITDFMKPFQEDGQLNVWIRDPLPTITQPEPDITEYMETFDRNNHFNPWIDPLPDIPASIQQDPTRPTSPSTRCWGWQL